LWGMPEFMDKKRIVRTKDYGGLGWIMGKCWLQEKRGIMGYNRIVGRKIVRETTNYGRHKILWV
jgi:hypothetical protein